ncbi:hypothetical protein AV530_002628 [Patagioenas fasciata monilis]|uniref:Uncharacterized protein n=1 Tax=Patagioenas fasciata monilis TaxID=372326 RepID=A0A1V4K767_PATFA|nr:hypothetical protein AV530_002628 [Patagioenas fasciata monilis]
MRRWAELRAEKEQGLSKGEESENLLEQPLDKWYLCRYLLTFAWTEEAKLVPQGDSRVPVASFAHGEAMAA